VLKTWLFSAACRRIKIQVQHIHAFHPNSPGGFKTLTGVDCFFNLGHFPSVSWFCNSFFHFPIRKGEFGSNQRNIHSGSQRRCRALAAREDQFQRLDLAAPQAWHDNLNLEFDFTLDPCCTHEPAKCSKHFTPGENGLAQSWAEETVFMNPPYGKEVGFWMKKACEEARDNLALVVCFVRASVDMEWWGHYAARATEIRFSKERVTYAGAETAAPFPVAIVIFRPRL